MSQNTNLNTNFTNTDVIKLGPQKLNSAFGNSDIVQKCSYSINAGIVLGLAGFMYLSVLALGTTYPVFSSFFKLIAPFIFSYGLVTIIKNGYYLYTGVIGKSDIYSLEEWLYLGICLLLNLMTLFIMARQVVILSPNLVPLAQDMINSKLTLTWPVVLFKAIGCGIFMYLAVRSGYLFTVVFSVAGFILCGFEHCLADWFYISVIITSGFSWSFIGFTILTIIGNTIGANVIRVVNEEIDVIALIEIIIKRLKNKFKNLTNKGD